MSYHLRLKRFPHQEMFPHKERLSLGMAPAIKTIIRLSSRSFARLVALTITCVLTGSDPLIVA